MYALGKDYRTSQSLSQQQYTTTNPKMMSVTRYCKQTKLPGDCVQCSSQPQKRKRTLYVCAACKLHMCGAMLFSISFKS